MEKVAFLLLPSYSAIAFFSALEPLRIANRLAARPLYRWTIHTPDGSDAQASNGMLMRTDGRLTDVNDTLIVCAGFDPLAHVRPELLGQIRRSWRAGAQVGAIDTGAFVLASAGILGRDPITLHWEAAHEFEAKFPGIPVSAELYERHARLFTCAGGTAAIDMMLDGIALSHGAALAEAVSQQLIYDAIRPASARQRASIAERGKGISPLVQKAIIAMEQGVASGRTLRDVLTDLGFVRRQLERHFKSRMQVSPGQFYSQLRIRRALDMMRDGRMSAQEAALAVGYSSPAVFSRACKVAFGQSPRALVSGPAQDFLRTRPRIGSGGDPQRAQP